jgi:hypothetical protein
MKNTSFSAKIKQAFLAASFMLAAIGSQAAVIGVSPGGYPPSSYVSGGLSPYGHTVTALSGLTASDFLGLDVVVLGRYDAGNAALSAFIAGGGTLITEWSSAGYGMSLLGGSASDNYGSYVTSDPVIFTGAGLGAGLGTALGASYSDFGATEFFQDFTSFGSGTVFATRGSSGAAAIVGGAYGAGYVWVNGYDWADSGSAPTFALLHNEISASHASVPDSGATVSLLVVAIAGLAAFRRRSIRA